MRREDSYKSDTAVNVQAALLANKKGGGYRSADANTPCTVSTGKRATCLVPPLQVGLNSPKPAGRSHCELQNEEQAPPLRLGVCWEFKAVVNPHADMVLAVKGFSSLTGGGSSLLQRRKVLKSKENRDVITRRA